MARKPMGFYPKEKGHVLTTIPGLDGFVSTGNVEQDLYGYWYEFVKGPEARWIVGEAPEGPGEGIDIAS